MKSQAIPEGRLRLATVVKSAGSVVHISDAEKALNIRRSQAVKLLSRWKSQGWLKRVGPGAYVPVQLELLGAAQVVEDPWILIPSLFGSAYIGGRTAAEHWDLTEQIFRDIIIFTTRRVAKPVVETQGATFTVFHISPKRMFGTQTVWRNQTKISVSDIHRTIVDMLNDPSANGGIQHVEDCFRAYLKRPDKDEGKLIECAERLGNGAVFKRLGFLAERNAVSEALQARCKAHLTKGNAYLDPALKSTRLLTRWRLWVPANWASEKSS